LTRIDHIVFAVCDLDAAARGLWTNFGLEAQPGGQHAGAGTSNLLVPVGNDQFIELLTVSDPASRHPIVPWLSKHLAQGDRLLQVAVDAGAIDTVAARLREPIGEVDRVSGDGRRVHFRLTGIAGGFGPEILPFFVECTAGQDWRCGFRRPRHRVAARGVVWVELGSDEARARAQVSDESFPLRFARGRPGVLAIGLDLDGKEVELRI